MKRASFLFFVIFSLRNEGLVAQKELTLSSPDHRIIFTFRLSDSAPMYKVAYKGKLILNYSTLKFSFAEGGAFGPNLKAGKPVFNEVDETYELVVGKTKNVHSHYRQLIIPLEERTSMDRKINLVVRAFDDGVGFRFQFPEQKWSSYTMTNESTQFNLNGNPLVRTLLLPDYTTSHEGEYSVMPYSEIKNDTLMDLPTLFQYDDQLFMSITEAALVDYAGMYLTKRGGR